jgi:hypothetical protein
MSGKAHKNSGGSFRFFDIVIILVFLSIAAFSVNLFRLDLMQTINLKNVEPVGIVIIKKNTVQRRHSNRVLWDRLSNESPVYLGDLIRVAEISAATLNIEDNGIDLDENTLVRIIRSADGESLQLSLQSGNLSLAADSGRSVIIDVNGKQVQAAPGAIISASSTTGGQVSVHVNRGSAQFVGGTGREISAGQAVTMDANGNELRQRTAVVISPIPNARYLKDGAEPFAVSFSWNRINLDPSQALRLDIGMDSNFNQIFRTINDLDNQARVFLDSGLWYWRLSFEDAALAAGRLTIADGSLELDSPAPNSLFPYNDDLPVINFQWKVVEEAVSYTIDISDTPDFSPVRFRVNSTTAFLSQPGLNGGSWYWRVRPVFPPVYQGTVSFSRPSSFRIERADTSIPLVQETLPDDELAPDDAPQIFAEAVVPAVNLLSPADGEGIAGLTALRNQTAFQWNTEADITSSRFVISSNANPLQGRSAVTRSNPGRTILVDRLGAGTWYWTVEIQTADGLTLSAPPRRLVVQAIPLLPAPGGMSPQRNARFDYDYLKSNRNINFRWNAVQGANAYIFTLYQQTPSGRRQVVQSTPENRLSYNFTDLSRLDRGTFVWQVEAVNRRGSAIEQRGRAGESVFILDFQLPLPVQIEDTGTLYGN